MLESEDSFHARSIAVRHPDNGSKVRVLVGDNIDPDSRSATRAASFQTRESLRRRPGSIRGNIIKYTFEKVLEQSRVYRIPAHFHDLEYDSSFDSSAIRSHT